MNALLHAIRNGSGILRRHMVRIASATLLSSAITLGHIGLASAAPQVGTSAAVRGDVYVTTSGAERKAKVKGVIRLQDQVLTRDDSALQILLLDRSTFTVGQNCTMVIDKFVYDPTTTAGEVSASVAKGAFRFMSGRIGKNNPTNAKVSTPSATIGIRGTFFEGVVGEDAIALAQLAGLSGAGADPNSASIIILRGPGANRNTLDTPGLITVSTGGGETLLNQPNTFVFTPGPGQPPIGPLPLNDAMQQYFDFFLRSEPNGPTENPLETGTGSGESNQASIVEANETIDDIIDNLDEGITDPNILVEPDDPPDTGYGYGCVSCGI